MSNAFNADGNTSGALLLTILTIRPSYSLSPLNLQAPEK